MKISLELECIEEDLAIFKKSLVFFLWNNPAAISWSKIEIDNKVIDFHKLRKEYTCGTGDNLDRLTDFQELIDKKYN